MPTYEYRCRECDHQLDIFQKISHDPIKECPACSQLALQRGPGGGIGLSFKGSGFYITDYAKSDGESKQENPQPKDCGKSTCACKTKG
ncbi:Uncharacterized protein SCG7086_BR_00020 [Chlamydiales bacterium SCGC AG-110-P3]|nr:Uncharacterized protein SCG7086_BR_00020 [Chlamydiales bacterium SCGC AG-110-P3]